MKNNKFCTFIETCRADIANRYGTAYAYSITNYRQVVAIWKSMNKPKKKEMPEEYHQITLAEYLEEVRHEQSNSRVQQTYI